MAAVAASEALHDALRAERTFAFQVSSPVFSRYLLLAPAPHRALRGCWRESQMLSDSICGWRATCLERTAVMLRTKCAGYAAAVLARVTA